ANYLTWESWLNWTVSIPFNNITNPNNCPIPINPAYLSDSKIRYKLKNVYFYDNSSILHETTSSQGEIANQFHLNQHPEDINQLNCYLLLTCYVSSAQGYYGSQVINNQSSIFVCSATNYTYSPLPWQNHFGYFQGHLPHELGHHLGLHHPYDSETLSTTNSDFLDDLFPNPPSYFLCNNMMGFQSNTLEKSLTPKQMGRMHRSLSTNLSNGVHTVVRHFAYGYSALPHNINTNETWDFTFKSYNDIVVKSGATLTLKCRLEMVPGSKIVVESGASLVINGATITSARCGGPEYEALWAGIDGQFNSVIVTQNGALIEDAQYGIKANNGTSIYLDNTTFNKCYIGVYTPASANGGNLINGHISGCTFKCDALLKPQFPGQTAIGDNVPNSNWGTYAGIRMDNVSFVINGGSNYNKFIGEPVSLTNGSTGYCLNAGIVGKNSNFTVSNCLYKNIVDYGNYDNESAGICVKGINGYYSLNETGLGKSTNSPITFENCDNAILAQSMNVNAHDNFMDQVSRGFLFEYNANRNIIFTNNLIYTRWMGVVSIFNDAAVGIDITDNKIHVGEYFNTAISSLITTGRGIDFNQWGLSTINCKISGNDIYLAKAASGICLNNVKNATLGFNNIYLNNAVYNQHALSLTACNNVNLNCSYVYGSSIATSDAQKGVYIASCNNSNIACVDVNNTYEGMHVDGICFNTFLSKNSFQNHYTGINIGATGAMPAHINRGNKWYFACANIDAINNGNPNQSQFKVTPYASPYKPHTFTPIGFFLPGTGNPPSGCSSTTCLDNTSPMTLEEEMAMDEAIAQGVLQTPIYTLPMDNEARSALFDRLSNDNNLLQNDSLFQNFYTNELIRNTDELRQVNEVAETIYQMTTSLALQIEQSQQSIQQNLVQTEQNNLLIEAGNLPDSVVENLNEVNRTLTISSESIQSYINTAFDALTNNRILNAQNILITNNGIITNLNFEQNQTQVNEIYFSTIAQNIFTFNASQAAILLSIAEQCPFAGGTAVYKARALYSLINPTKTYNDKLICLNEGVVLRKAFTLQEQKINNEQNSASIQPNPTNDLLTITYSFSNEKSGKFLVYDLLGKVKFETILEPDKKSESINTKTIPEGIYIYSISNENGNIQNGKLIIQH
ncbi:MAG TPA: T9SS type A sorting domain-containing protein, partial [Bacteroidia bacterium]|nr:T9SS type A sorting domain-containing protein [Bacteroidia bacterium]